MTTSIFELMPKIDFWNYDSFLVCRKKEWLLSSVMCQQNFSENLTCILYLHQTFEPVTEFHVEIEVKVLGLTFFRRKI